MKKQVIVTDTNLTDFEAAVDEYLYTGWLVAHLSCGLDSGAITLSSSGSHGLYDPIVLNNAFIAILERPND